ncbi:MAG TPA: DUF3943 domain-containing protein [Labilithrix sp.]|nr:DUF3943 domain-containing protein [Labilithrix sp.]
MTPAAVALTIAALADAAALAEPAVVPQPPPDDRPSLVIPIVHGLALMSVMRVGESLLYPDPFSRSEHFAAHYEEAFTRPPLFDASRRAFEWDGDSWTINVLGHGLFGSELYLRARTCRLPWYGALAFAAASSTLWEYAFEANGVRPSALDLVYTPLAGMVLGEGRYLAWRSAAGIRAPALRTVLRAAVDPFGEVERAFGAGC